MTHIETAKAAIEKIGKETWETRDYIDGLLDYILKQAEYADSLQNHCYTLWRGIQFGLNNIPIDTVNFMHDCDKARWQEENAKGTDA